MLVDLSEAEILYIRYHMDTLSDIDRKRIKEIEKEYMGCASTMVGKLRQASVDCLLKAKAVAAGDTPAERKKRAVWDAIHDSARGG